MGAGVLSKDRYTYEPIIEIIGILILSVGFISLRMINKSTVSLVIAPVYSCYGVCFATFMLFIYDSSSIAKFAKDRKEIYIGLAVS